MDSKNTLSLENTLCCPRGGCEVAGMGLCPGPLDPGEDTGCRVPAWRKLPRALRGPRCWSSIFTAVQTVTICTDKPFLPFLLPPSSPPFFNSSL